ncbi:DUF6415 family natural product biosynthesis protein [Streptomyces sp. NPDC005917]|uniref:DUF6415 family natural product biosynthesis protein n=1 Tax=unclassified Streptomyces TaxID=2593676 RepID=UPI0033FE9993
MATSTTGQPAETEQVEALPLDIPTMRATARRLLAADAGEPAADEVPVLLSTLRGHLELIVPVVERCAAFKPDDDQRWMAPVNCAIIAAADTRRAMSAEIHPGADAAVRHARRLARRLNAMCDHFETLISDPIGPDDGSSR